MTHVCCPGCRLRFAPAVAAHLTSCPTCDEPLEPGASAARTLGFRLVTQDGLDDAFAAGRGTVTVPDPRGTGS